MEMTVQWKEMEQFVGISNGGAEIPIDGETKKGASPMELLLMGLGGCTGADIVTILQKMRVAFNGFLVQMSSERREEPPRAFTKIVLHYQIWGEEIPEDKYERAVNLSVEKYCSVMHSLNPAIEFEIKREIFSSK